MSLEDDAELYRRVRPTKLLTTKTWGNVDHLPRHSRSELSVDAEPVLRSAGLDWHFSLSNHPGFSLQALRRSRSDLKPHRGTKPETDNPAHTEVTGKKTQGQPTCCAMRPVDLSRAKGIDTPAMAVARVGVRGGEGCRRRTPAH